MQKIFLAIFCLFSSFFTPVFGQFRWQNPAPQGNDLFAVFAPTAETCWMAGEHGTLLFWENGHLEPVASNTSETISDLWFSDPEHGWAAGQNGTLLRFENGKWQNWPSGTDKNLNDLWFNNPADGWAVGDGGTVLHFDGQAWNIQNALTSDLTSVVFSENGTGWISGFNSQIYRLEGNEWKFQIKLSNKAHSCKFDFWGEPKDTNLLFLGAIPDLGLLYDNPFASRFDGTKWKGFQPGYSQFLYDVEMKSDGSVFAGSSSGLIERAGNQWDTIVPLVNWERSLRKIHILDDGNIWAVGTNGTTLHFQNGNWETLSRGNTQSFRFGPEIFSPQNGWTASYDKLLQFEDGFWQEKLKFPYSLRTFDFADSSNAVFCLFVPFADSTNIYRFKNGKLTPDWTAPNFSPARVFQFNDSAIFLVHLIQTYHFDGKNWNLEHFATRDSAYFQAIDFLNDSVGFAVAPFEETSGQFPNNLYSVIWRRTFPGNWEKIGDQFRPGFTSVDVLDENEVWFGGGFPACNSWFGGIDTIRSFIYRMKNGILEKQFETTGHHAFSFLKIIDPENGYAVTCDGLVYEMKNQVWKKLELPTYHAIHSVAALDTAQVWFFGDGGLILKKGDNGTFLPAPIVPEKLISLKIFPNPTAGGFEIEFPQALENHGVCFVFDDTGRLCRKFAVPRNSSRLVVSDWQNFSSGNYNVLLRDGEKAFLGKIVFLKK